MATILIDNFNSYDDGDLPGQGSWENYANGQYFDVQGSVVFEGAKAVYATGIIDAVVTKAGSALSTGRQTVYFRSTGRAGWTSAAYGMLRVTKGSNGAPFLAIKLTKDGKWYYFNGTAYIEGSGTWAEGSWNSLEFEWRSSDKTARYRINQGAWTAWTTFYGAGSFVNFDYVLMEWYNTTGGTGGFYIDTWQENPVGGEVKTGSATLSGTGSLTAQGSYLRLATASFAGIGSLSAQGGVIRLGAATLSGTGTLAAVARCIRSAAATLAGEGSLSAAGVITGLTATLLAAQKKAHRLPYVEAKVYDYEQGIKRLSWTRIYTGSEPDNHHGIAFDGQGSMHRIRAAADDKLYYQKITGPGPSSDYSQWTEIVSDCTGPCAIAAQGARIYIFYKTTSNVLWKCYSSDYGQTWNDAQLVSYADVLSLAACWWGAGNIVVCFALKSNQLNGITLDTSTQVATQHTWSDGNHPLLDTYGIGATYNPFWPGMELVFAGKENDSPYDHYDLFRTKFSNTYNFLALESFLMAPDGEDMTYEYPDCHLPASAHPYETNRIIAVEKYTGTTAYTRPLICHMVKGTNWSSTTFTEPKPFLDISSNYGFRIQSTANYWWFSRPDGVWRAPRPADPPIDLTKNIVSLIADSSQLTALRIELDNSKGQYASPGEGDLASLRFRSEIVLRLGYKTPAGDEAVDAGIYWIDSWEYSSKPNMSRFILTCLDGLGLMDRWTARYQMRWNKDEVNPRSVWHILYQLLARVGINLTNTPPKPQSSAINNLYPDFTVNPGAHGDTAIRRLLSFVPDRLVFRGQEAFTKNPLPAEASSYSYGVGAADHAILSGKYSDAVTASRALVIGRDSSDDRILEEALDPDLSGLAIDILEQDYDPNLQTTTRTQERADALLRTQQTLRTPSSIVIPPSVGQELLDVVEVTDARCDISEEKYRVQTIRTDYDRRQGIYTQRLALYTP